METEKLNKGTLDRLKRIMELKDCDEEEALEFAIACGWLNMEKLADRRKVKETITKQ